MKRTLPPTELEEEVADLWLRLVAEQCFDAEVATFLKMFGPWAEAQIKARLDS